MIKRVKVETDTERVQDCQGCVFRGLPSQRCGCPDDLPDCWEGDQGYIYVEVSDV